MKEISVGNRVKVTSAESQYFGCFGVVQEENTGAFRVQLELPSPLLFYFSPDQIEPAAPLEKTEDLNTTVLVACSATKPPVMNMTLPTDSAERKNYPMFSGLLRYFPAALAGVANISKVGNDKHNPGQPLHHARHKSTDHGDCILRHLTDVEDLLAAQSRGVPVIKTAILTEVNQMCWRALAFAQEVHEKLGAPLAPGAVTNNPNETNNTAKGTENV